MELMLKLFDLTGVLIEKIEAHATVGLNAFLVVISVLFFYCPANLKYVNIKICYAPPILSFIYHYTIYIGYIPYIPVYKSTLFLLFLYPKYDPRLIHRT